MSKKKIDDNEKEGIMVDPLEWIKANPSKLKTVTNKYGGKYSPHNIMRRKDEALIKVIQESQEKCIQLRLRYRDFILFYRLCYNHGYDPQTFVKMLVAKFDVKDEELMCWLEKNRNLDPKEKRNPLDYTQDEIYSMLENAAKNKEEK